MTISIFKRYLPNKFRRLLRYLYFIPKQIGRPKVFCISMQRSGTTSVGEFLKDHGFKVARESDSVNHNWSYLWYLGDFKSIIKSLAFKSFQAYEDAPWWCPDFYKFLYHHFPNSKFIFFYRDPDKWFDSMKSLKNGKIPGNTRRHCKIYHRMSEFYDKLDNDPNFQPTWTKKDQLLRLDNMREHYIKTYEENKREIIEFFNKVKPDALFVGRLEDDKKWQKLGDFLDIKVNENYNVHANKSKK